MRAADYTETSKSSMSTNMNQTLITIGLILDIVGVCILFRHGLPGAIRRNIKFARNIDLVDSVDELTPEEREQDRHQIEQEKLWKLGARIGQWSALAFLVIGFSLQIVGVWIDDEPEKECEGCRILYIV